MNGHGAIARIRQARLAMVEAAHYLGREWAQQAEFAALERAEVAIGTLTDFEAATGPASGECHVAFFAIHPDRDGDFDASTTFWASVVGEPSPPRFVVEAFLEAAARYFREADIDAMGG